MTLWIPTNFLITVVTTDHHRAHPPHRAKPMPHHIISSYNIMDNIIVSMPECAIPPPSRTSKSGVSHRADHLPQLMLSLRSLQPRVRNTRTPSPHSTHRSIRSTILHHLCCAHKYWVHSSTCNTRPGNRRHLSPHARTRQKYRRLENIHWHQQGLQAETSEYSAGSVLPHTQEKINSIRRSNMPHSANLPPQRMQETHKPRHRQNRQANEEPNQQRHRIRSFFPTNWGQTGSRGP